ncbi:hypothetical protein [Jeongeupia sp. HS-3]|uniref:hypothetical protein n=1 Tax=Jeongeupia sp. HS-3 TaxID=1009682 RepID=UPI00190FC36F|nr:hypothetical protein [Jeongeupia sp. HS-3]
MLVTVLIALVAAVASVYASRATLTAQQSASNDYQQMLARTAAEEGADQFTKQVLDDLAELSKATPGTTYVLQAGTSSPSSTCAPGSAELPYEFKSTYADSTNKKIFANSKFYTRSVSPIAAVTGTDQGTAWAVRAQISGDKILLDSVGCTGNAGVGHAICSAAPTLARTRRTLELEGLVNLGSSAVTVGNYVDSRGAINVTTATPSDPKPKCAMTYGDSYNYVGSPGLQCESGACIPLANAGLKNNLFQQIFGATKADIAANADRVLAGGCAGSSITGLVDDEVVWINGDVTNCTFEGSTKAVIIVNGNIRGSLRATGLVYANNLYQSGEVEVLGSIVVENAWDKGALGELFTNGYHQYPNHINDEAPGATFSDGVFSPTYGAAPTNQSLTVTHSASGAIKVNYKSFTFKPIVPIVTKSFPGSWIDF